MRDQVKPVVTGRIRSKERYLNYYQIGMALLLTVTWVIAVTIVIYSIVE